MANPYPPMQQPMMQPPMGTGQGPAQMPQGPQARPPGNVMRRGTSKAVPVVVSAGLAIGVFCGLLFGLGVDKEATAEPTVTTAETPKKKDDAVAAPFQPEAKKDVKVPSLAPQVVNKDGTTTPQKADAGSGSGSAAKTDKPVEPPKPVKVNGTLKIEIEPAEAAKVAKVTIDGKDIDGLSYELDMTEDVKAATKGSGQGPDGALKPDAKKPDVKKELKFTVKASGYRDYSGKVEIFAERDTSVKVPMQKRSSTPVGGGLPRPPPGGYVKPPAGNGGGGGQKCKKPPCGLIDI